MIKYKSYEAFYYGKKRKETCTQSSNDRGKAKHHSAASSVV